MTPREYAEYARAWVAARLQVYGSSSKCHDLQRQMKPSPISARAVLMDVALRKVSADLVLTNAQVVNVHTREVLASDIAIKHGRIAIVVPRGSVQWHDDEPRHDLAGQHVCPGFIDPHVHVESSMVTVREFSRAVVPRGVTTIAADPHEMGNVLGVEGMRAMFDEARHVPLRMLLRVPGRIPAMPEHLETSGASLDLAATAEMLGWPEAVCLAGDINPALILRQDAGQFARIDLALQHGMTVSGQSPGLSGATLCAYVAGGPEDSHVAMDVAEVLANQRLGLRSILTIRAGRRLDRAQFKQLADLARDGGLDTRYLQFCTDDVLPHRMEDEGHLEHRVRVAIDEGFDPATAIQMATINVAEGLRIDREFGSITPGRHADLLVLSDLRTVAVASVMIDGKWVFHEGRYVEPPTTWRYPEEARQTMRIYREVKSEELRISAPSDAATAVVRVLRTSTPKACETVQLAVAGGAIQPDSERGISAIAMLDRHSGKVAVGRGFMTGLSLKRGAIASTVSHDAHNLRVIGASHTDMALAANRTIAIGGGYVLALDGRILLEVPLPIAGLMSERPLAEMAALTREMERVLLDMLGCPHQREMMLLLSNFCLPNIPEFGLTDAGLIGTRLMERMPVVLQFFNALGEKVTGATDAVDADARGFHAPSLARSCRCGVGL